MASPSTVLKPKTPEGKENQMLGLIALSSSPSPSTLLNPSLIAFPSHHHHYKHHFALIKRPTVTTNNNTQWRLCFSYEVGGGYPAEDFNSHKNKTLFDGDQKMDNAQYEALLKGGDQVTSVLQEMITLVCFHSAAISTI